MIFDEKSKAVKFLFLGNYFLETRKLFGVVFDF